MKVHVVVPALRESDLVPAFLESRSGIEDREIEMYRVNGKPGDNTSEPAGTWSGRCRVREMEGRPDLFRTGLACLGLVLLS